MKLLGTYWTDCHEIWYWSVFRKYLEDVQVSFNSDDNNGNSNEIQYTFLNLTRLILLRMGNISDNRCRKNQSTHFISSNFFNKNRAVYETARKNMVQPYKPKICIAGWINKATDIHSEYVILITLRRQKWLCERDSVLRYTYIAYIVRISVWMSK